MDEYICVLDHNTTDESCLAYPCRLKVTLGSMRPTSCPYNIELNCRWERVTENKYPFGSTCTKLAFDFRSSDKNE